MKLLPVVTLLTSFNLKVS